MGFVAILLIFLVFENINCARDTSEAITECLKAEPVSEDVAKEILANNSSWLFQNMQNKRTNYNVQCFLKCILEHLKIVDGNGHIVASALEEYLDIDQFIPDMKTYPKEEFEKHVKNCHENIGSSGGDRCYKVYLQLRCLSNSTDTEMNTEI